MNMSIYPMTYHSILFLLLKCFHMTEVYIPFYYYYYFNKFIYFIFGCVGSLLWCVGFSLRGPLLLRSTGSRRRGFSSCGSQALERRLSSCGAQAYLLRGMWDLPRPGLEPVSPALAGGFLTTVPPGKPYPLL